MHVFVKIYVQNCMYFLMIKNLRFELSFKTISQLENKLNFCKLYNLTNINIPCKGPIKKELFNSTQEMP